MAGDWIKWEHDLPNKPEVVRIASDLGLSREVVSCRLMKFWEWCDKTIPESAISDNGSAFVKMSPRDGDNAAFIDALAGTPGFADSLAAVEWIRFRDGRIELPNFGRHNGETAKTRARNSKLQKKKRTSSDGQKKPNHQDQDGEHVSDLSPRDSDKKVTRGEERREELIHKPKSTQYTHSCEEPKRVCGDAARMTRKIKGEGEFGPDFEAFRSAYGNKNNRRAAERAWADATIDVDPSVIIQAAVNQTSLYVELGIEVGRMKAPDRWLLDGCWDNPLSEMRSLLMSIQKTKPVATISEPVL